MRDWKEDGREEKTRKKKGGWIDSKLDKEKKGESVQQRGGGRQN